MGYIVDIQSKNTGAGNIGGNHIFTGNKHTERPHLFIGKRSGKIMTVNRSFNAFNQGVTSGLM